MAPSAGTLDLSQGVPGLPGVIDDTDKQAVSATRFVREARLASQLGVIDDTDKQAVSATAEAIESRSIARGRGSMDRRPVRAKRLTRRCLPERRLSVPSRRP